MSNAFAYVQRIGVLRTTFEGGIIPPQWCGESAGPDAGLAVVSALRIRRLPNLGYRFWHRRAQVCRQADQSSCGRSNERFRCPMPSWSPRSNIHDDQHGRYIVAVVAHAEQSLARFGQQRANVAALAQIKRQADTAADLNQQRYKAGAISQADLNTSFRQRRQAEADLNRSIAAMTNSWIAIQKSLGLGWRELVTTQAVADRESYW